LASIANQPMVLAGCLDIDSSRKAARFVRFLRRLRNSAADAGRRARIPARHQPGVRRRHQARGQAAVCLSVEATVPKVTVITRKAYGGAYDVMASKAPAIR
jgi:propionyl-CoA carboxylase beta chain